MKNPGTTSRSKALCDGLACRAKHGEITLFFIKNRKKKRSPVRPSKEKLTIWQKDNIFPRVKLFFFF